MKKVINTIFFWVNLIFFVLNSYFLWHCYPRLPQNLSFDYMGIIVGLLSLLVGFLVAWQIYKTIEVDKKVENIGQQAQSIIDKVMTEKINAMDATMTFSFVLNYAHSMYTKNFTQYAMDGYIDAINVAIQNNLERKYINVAVQGIQKIINENDVCALALPLLPDKKNFYYDILSKIEPKNDDIRFLCNYVLNKTRDEEMGFPPGNLRTMSNYNPDTEKLEKN